MAFKALITFVVAICGAGLGYGAEISRAPRIVGGSYAQENQYPYQVSLHMWTKYPSYQCGAAIVSNYYLVTAAHCVFHEGRRIDASNLSVRVGSNYNYYGGSVFCVSETILHPSYYGDEFNYDIALLRLSYPLIFSESVAPISLATSPPPLGAEVTIMGWGRTGINEGGSCYLKYSKMVREECMGDPKTLLCLKGDGVNAACKGDSGSAGVYNGTLVGVVSGGHGVCAIESPAFYIMVSEFHNWLIENSDL